MQDVLSVLRGKIGDSYGSILRDTGCSDVVVKQQLVNGVQYTGRYSYMQMKDDSVRRVPMATVNLDTLYYVGTIEALCPRDAIYNAIIRNIPGARAAEIPDPMWSKVGVVTRGQASRGDGVLPLAVFKPNLWKDID